MRKATLPLLRLSPKSPFRDNYFLFADHSATGETRKALFPTMSLHFASLAGAVRPCFGPVNYIEMRYEIVEGDQNGSGVWLDNRSIRFCAGKPSYCLHRCPKRQDNKFNRIVKIVKRVTKQVGTPISFDGVQRWKHFRGGVPNVLVSFFNG